MDNDVRGQMTDLDEFIDRVLDIPLYPWQKNLIRRLGEKGRIVVLMPRNRASRAEIFDD